MNQRTQKHPVENTNFNLNSWIFASFLAGGILMGAESALLGGNLWPITAFIGAIGGLLVGICSGIAIKLTNATPKERRICFLGICIMAVVGTFMAAYQRPGS